MKSVLRAVARTFLPIGMVKAVNAGLRNASAAGHWLQYKLEWHVAKRTPEWFDHHIDQYWKWNQTGNPLSWERGVFGLLPIRDGARVLDLCCGGGFFAHHFFASRATKVTSVDFDPSAIAHARRNFHAPNVEYVCADIRTGMPEGTFDNIVWDAAIEHFTLEEMFGILTNIKRRLTPSGILGGYTLVATDHKALDDHEHEFESKEELAKVLQPHFRNVLVFETRYQRVSDPRDNLYFFASDGPLPFDAGDPFVHRARRS